MIATLGDYQIKKGLSEKQIDQLIEYSANDEDIANFTSDKTRFKDRAGYDEFSTHILAYYVLTDNLDNLLGIIWFDDFVVKELPKDYGISFAVRLYGEARGKGLSEEFTQTVFNDFYKSEDYKSHPHKKIWLSVSPENEPAISLYRKLGFKDLEINKEYNKLLMVLG